MRAPTSGAWAAPAPRILALGLPLLLVAGCFGGSDAPPKAVALAFAPDAEYDADHGAIKGLVTSPEVEPIVGADLLLRPGDRQASTALDGGYVFSMVDPGDYTLLVSRLGYEPVQRPVQVVAGELTSLDLELKEVYVPRPYYDVVGPFQGYFECRWAGVGSGPCGYAGIGGVSTQPVTEILWTKDNVSIFFNLDSAEWQEIVFESRWTPSSAATNSKMELLFSYKDRPATHLYGRSTGQASPLWYNYTKGVAHAGSQGGAPGEPDQNTTQRAWLALDTSLSPTDFHPFSVGYEMRYEMMVTVFYSQRAPEGYTAWED